MNDWLSSRPVWTLVPLFWLVTFVGAMLGVTVARAFDSHMWPALGAQAGLVALGCLCPAVGATWGTVWRRRREARRIR